MRCAGLTLDTVAICTRGELAGPLPLDMSLAPPGYRHRLFGACGCGQVHSDAPRRQVVPAIPPIRPPTLPVERRDEIYTFAFRGLPLRKEAADDLRRRGLTDEDTRSHRLASVPLRMRERADLVDSVRERFGDEALRSCPGFHDKNGRLVLSPAIRGQDGYVVPYLDEHRRITGFQVKVLGSRYLTPSGTRYAEVYCVAGQQSDLLWVVEGGLKAIVAAALGGLWCFGVPGQSLQPEHLQAIRGLNPERVAVALDRETNPDTDRARMAWLTALATEGFATYDAVWEQA